jgi:O-antigen/teichoic acid export membrane protein
VKRQSTLLVQHFFWSLFGTGLPLVLGIVTIPMILEGLGMVSFGLLTLIWTAIGYFGLFDFGLGRALTQRVAAMRAHKGSLDLAEIAQGLWLVIFFGLLGALFMHGVGLYYVNVVLDLKGPALREAQLAVVISAWSIPLVTVSSGLRGILEGLEAFKKAGLLRGFLGTLNFLLPWCMVVMGHASLVWMVWSLVLARGVNVCLNFWWLRGVLSKGLFTVAPRWGKAKSLFRFGYWMTISNVVGPFMVAADRFLVAGALGTGMLAYYTVPQDAVLRLLVLPAAWSTIWFPRFTKVYMQGNVKSMQSELRGGMRVVFWVMGPLCLVLGYFVLPLLGIWLGEPFASNTWMVARVLLLGLFLNAMAHLPLAAIQAIGRVDFTAKLHVLELLLFVPGLMFAVSQWGIMGAAWAWTVRTAVDFVFLFIFSHKITQHGSTL